MEGEPFVSNAFGDQYLFSLNRDDFSERPCAELYAARFGHALLKPGTFYLFIGTDAGLLPTYLAAQDLPRGSRYCFIETPEILERLRQRGLVEGFHYFDSDSLADAIERMVSDGVIYYMADHAFVLENSLAAQHDFIDRYGVIGAEFSQRFEAYLKFNMGNVVVDLHRSNGIRNSQESPLHGACLRGVLPGATAVVVAAGPSLGAYLPWLKAQRGRLLVIAVSRVSGLLRSLGVRPDVLVHCDPKDLGLERAMGIFHFPEALFAYVSSANTTLVGQWAGPRVVLDRNALIGRLFPGLPEILGSGSTVSNIAIDLAAHMGARRIVLLGVDLCHSAAGSQHAAGSADFDCPLIQLNVMKVRTNRGDTAFTTPDYARAAAELEQQARMLRQRGVELVNPAPKAMALDHVAHLPLAQIRPDPLPGDVAEMIQRACGTVDYPAFYQRLEALLDASEARIEELRGRAARVLAAPGDAPPDAGGQRELLELIEVSQTDPDVQLALSLSWQPVHAALKGVYAGGGSRMERGATQRDYLRALDQVLAYMGTLLVETRRRLACRRNEADGMRDIEGILDQWERDGHPGRALMVDARALQRAGGIARSALARIEQMGQRFRETLGRESCARGIPREHGLDNVVPRVNYLRRARDREGFSHLLGILGCYPANQAAPYIAFTRGMQAECEGDSRRALSHYQAALADLDSPVIESAMKRIAEICLEGDDYENAVYALESLTQMSDIYAPGFVDLLDAVGQPGDAIAVYEQYTRAHPGDAASLANLGRLYYKVGRGAELEGVVAGRNRPKQKTHTET